MYRLVEELVTDASPGPQEVSRARRAVAQTLRKWQVDGDPADIAILLTSELVTNAITHGQGPITVSLRMGEHAELRIEVTDADPGPLRPRHASLDDAGGRGLYLVDALADSWGAEHRDEGGKRVWFELSTG